ncbi:Cof-type HAD-IIB family hydrolase [Bacillus kwashiorkori]|uniref:Cof-type HAD-IIB family hydrolase n=1 Tax=Bacillus kwashiorkori TaxID=1522318 RepID=UPI0007846542|nr:Cof-type HAD-IIB family hydrolase [Bacillus kwashiorkori]
MKDRYLIALDLDGTLLKDDKTISTKTKKVLKQIQQDGHVVMISTGRPYRSSAMYYKELQLSSPIVNFNGAFVHHPQQPDWGRFHEPLNVSVVKDIVDTCSQFEVKNIIAEVIDDIYIQNHDEQLIDIFSIGNPNISTGDIRLSLKDNPTSMLIHADNGRMKAIRDYLSDVHTDVVEHRSWGVPWNVIEIVKHGINKAVGVQKVADYYQIPQDRIIAFGDEDNDLEMLQYAKYGVAMGNGIHLVKEVAKDTTLTNEEDGVAVYLEKFLL